MDLSASGAVFADIIAEVKFLKKEKKRRRKIRTDNGRKIAVKEGLKVWAL